MTTGTEDHSYFGNDGLERCARCNIRHERANAGPPPPPPPGGEVGKADHPVKVGAEVVVTDMLHFHQAGPPAARGGAPTGGYPGGAPGFYGSAADTHGTGNNQCGSSFYGPAYGSHQGVGAGVSQPNDAAGYPSSVASGGNLGPGLSLGYSVNGAGRQGDGGLLPEALRGDDGWDKCTKCSRIPEPGYPAPSSRRNAANIT